MNRRTRMISFRVSQDELDHFREFCTESGSRSVSELARNAVHRMVSGSEGTIGWGSRIDALEKEIERLRDLFTAGAAAGPSSKKEET